MWVPFFLLHFNQYNLPRITVRQTRDPLCDNIEYIAFCKVTLEANGDLNVKNIGVGKPKDRFIVRIIPVLTIPCWLWHQAIYDGKFFYLAKDKLIPALDIKKYTSETDEPILSVVSEHYVPFHISFRLLINSFQSHSDILAAEIRIELAAQITYLKGLFSHAWTSLASTLCPASSNNESQIADSLLQASWQNSESYFCGLRPSILNCLRRKDSGGYYVKLEEVI